MDFAFHPLRFQFTASEPIYFPEGKAGNILRGAFGFALRGSGEEDYERVFRPSSGGEGPSGFSDRPRSFVFRARHLDGRTLRPGEPFHFDAHLFDVRRPPIADFVRAFAQIAHDGIGPRRGRADPAGVWQLDAVGRPCAKVSDAAPPPPLRLPLDAPAKNVTAIRVDFLSPTELKAGAQLAGRPEFPILFARIRDRLSTLRAIYGEGPLTIDFKTMGEQAETVRMTRCELRNVEVERRSGRTGQAHPLGGFVGFAEYSGDLAEFLPYLEAARWTGVGRQTVWGKGEIAVSGS